ADAGRQPAVDAVAIGLAAATLFGLLALGTYNRFDPPGSLAWLPANAPPSPDVHNVCGRAGAEVAHALLTTLGVGAWYAIASLAALAGCLLARRKIDQPATRAAGWAMSLVGVTTLASLLLPAWSPGPMVGAGGYLGAMGRSLLEANFAGTGSFLFATAVLLAGLLLATDYLLFRVAAAATALTGAGMVKAGSLSQAAAKRMARPRTDLDTDAVDADEDAEDGEEEDDEEYEYEEEEDEAQDDEDDEYETEDAADGNDPDENDADQDDADDDGKRSGLTIKTPTGEVLGAEGAAHASRSDAAAHGGSGNRAATQHTEPTSTLTAAASGLKQTIAAALGGGKKAADEPAGEPAAEEGKHQKKKEKPKSEREMILDELDKAAQEHDVDPDYDLPPVDLLLAGEEANYEAQEKEIR
ncbi:MAG: DNA translocase FtsK 4TM domain-containing protein, partial [Planctomycetota bacterium]